MITCGMRWKDPESHLFQEKRKKRDEDKEKRNRGPRAEKMRSEKGGGERGRDGLV